MSNHDTAATTQYGNGKKTLKSYVFGLVSSLVLTFTAFGLVAKHLLNDQAIYVAITALALVQLLAQVVFFLRMNVRSNEGRWNSMPFLFVFIIVLILVLGSLWIMYNLNFNMTH